MTLTQPKAVRIGVVALIALTLVNVVLLFSIPTPPGTDASSLVALKMLALMLFDLPLIIATVVLSVFAYRGSNKARIALAIIYLLVLLGTVWNFGKVLVGYDLWSIVSLAIVVLQCVAITLLYSDDSRRWFADDSQRIRAAQQTHAARRDA